MKPEQERDRCHEPDRREQNGSGCPREQGGASKWPNVMEHVWQETDEAAPNREERTPGARDDCPGLRKEEAPAAGGSDELSGVDLAR